MATPIRFDMQGFATRVQERRRVLGWSQTELAKRAELNLGNINEVEHARKRHVRADTLVSLAVALGVSTDYLLGLSDDPHPPRQRRRPRKADAESVDPPARVRQGGAWAGQVWISPDFDDTDEELLRLFEGEEDDAAPR